MNPGIEHTALYSYFNAAMRPTAILSELLDNSFDSGADAIHVEISKSGLAVCDNGEGIEDIEKMFRIGASGRHSDAMAIGKYGVGGKHALLSVGSRFDIATRNNGRCVEVQVDWMKFARHGFRPIPDPLPVPEDRLSKPNREAMQAGWNTRVSVDKKHNRRSWAGVPSIIKAMAMRYRPALMSGAKVTIAAQGEIYNLADQEYADPQLSDIVLKNLIVAGKRATVRAGIADKHIPAMTGRLLISYGPRVIETPREVGDQNIHNQLYVEVVLSADWRDSLSTHKNELITDRDELLLEVWAVIKPLSDLLRDVQRERTFELVCDGLKKRLSEAVKQVRKSGNKRVRRDVSGANPVICPFSDNGPGNGPKPNERRPLEQRGVVEEGNNDTEDVDCDEPDRGNVEFKVIANKNIECHCLVQSIVDISNRNACIDVSINTSAPIVEKAFDDGGDALLLMVAHALAEHFCTDAKEVESRMLFPGVLDDYGPFDGYDMKASILAGKIISSLSAMDRIKKEDALI